MTSNDLPRHERDIRQIVTLLEAVDRGDHGRVTPLPERAVLERVAESDRQYVLAIAAAADEHRRDAGSARAIRWSEEAARIARERKQTAEDKKKQAEDKADDQRLVEAAAALAIGYAAAPPARPAAAARETTERTRRSDWQKAARNIAAATGEISTGDVAPNLSPVHPSELTDDLRRDLHAAAKCGGKLARTRVRRSTQRFRGPNALDVAASMQPSARHRCRARTLTPIPAYQATS